MSNPMIDKVSIENYGCIKKRVELNLTPIHALIGPNDSGKSTILRAIRTAMHMGASHFIEQSGHMTPFDPGLAASPNAAISIESAALARGFEMRAVSGNFQETIFRLQDHGLMCQQTRPHITASGLGGGAGQNEKMTAFMRQGVRFLRLDPDALRAPSSLIKEGDAVLLKDERGAGLPGVYDNIVNRGDDTFRSIVDRVKRLFPSVKNLGLKNISDSRKILRVTLQGGEEVSAEFLSDGLLYFLAFAAAEHLEPTALLLVEEPENGLHPARIAQVIEVLRRISTTTQVLLTTHSPLVVNELAGDEVSVITRDADGTKAVRLSETPSYVERSKIYANGELWVSYSDGAQESALLDGGPRP